MSSGGALVPKGAFDWVGFSKHSVTFTVDTLSRMSKAGVEALTVFASRALFQQVKLDARGERRLLDALEKLGVFSSRNNALWFGFGIKHLTRDLAETSEGLACVGICACLTEEYGHLTSAK
ncbi:MAG: hypothetical protein M1822_008016, partial [Bathelium mastoideum]